MLCSEKLKLKSEIEILKGPVRVLLTAWCTIGMFGFDCPHESATLGHLSLKLGKKSISRPCFVPAPSLSVNWRVEYI